MESVSTPRVTAPYLESHIGQTVMVVGQVIQLRGNDATIEADGQIAVTLGPQSHLTSGNGVQIIGRVNPDGSIKVMTSLDLGNNVDYDVSQAVVNVTHNCKELFVFQN